MRALFFGTPEIAVGSLLALAEIAEIVGVVCQPDRPAGRGLQVRPPAVKLAALARGFDVVQPERIRTPEFLEWLGGREADVALVIAYGRILPAAALGVPRLGFVNLHASLLPRYRGAAPIQRALMKGETETGVCLMQMDEGMDTGPLLACRRMPIGQEDNAGSLFEKLGELAATVTSLELPRLFGGQLSPVPQVEAMSSYAPPIRREDTLLSFRRSTAQALHDQIRGLSPRPGAVANVMSPRSQALKILRTKPVEPFLHPAPGTVAVDGGRVFVGAGEGTLLELLEAQVQGKKPLTARELINGRSLKEGDQLE